MAVVATAVLVSVYWRMHGHGHIKSVGIKIYDSAQCVNVVSEIDWGTIDVGGSSQVTLWVKNSGNSNVTLTLSSENYSPAAVQQFLTLSWNHTATKWLLPGEVEAIVFKLQVSPTVSGITDFYFDIIVTATG